MDGLTDVLEIFGVGKGDDDDEDEDNESGLEEEEEETGYNGAFAAPLSRPAATGRAAIPERIEVIDLTS